MRPQSLHLLPFAFLLKPMHAPPFLELTSQGKCFYLHPNFNPYLMGGERNKDLQQLERGRNEWANSIRWKGHRARPKGRNIAPAGHRPSLQRLKVVGHWSAIAVKHKCAAVETVQRGRGGSLQTLSRLQRGGGHCRCFSQHFPKKKIFQFQWHHSGRIVQIDQDMIYSPLSLGNIHPYMPKFVSQSQTQWRDLKLS